MNASEPNEQPGRSTRAQWRSQQAIAQRFVTDLGVKPGIEQVTIFRKVDDVWSAWATTATERLPQQILAGDAAQYAQQALDEGRTVIGLTATLYAPIHAANTLVLYVDLERDPDPTLIALGEALGQQLSLMLEDGASRQHLLRLLSELVEHKTDDEATFLEHATALIRDLVQVQRVYISLVDPVDNVMTVAATAPAPQAVRQNVMFDSETLTALFQADQSPLTVPDLATSELLDDPLRTALLAVGYEAAVMVPLVGDDQQLFGLVTLFDDAGIAQFNDRNLYLIEAVASQVTAHVQRLRVLKRTQRQAHQLRQITEFGQLLQASLDLEDCLTFALQFSQTIIPSDYFVVMLYDDVTKGLRMSATYRDGESVVTLPGDSVAYEANSVTQTAWDEQTLVRVDNLRADWEWRHPIDNVLRTVIACPLRVQGQSLGIVEIGNYQENAYNTLDVVALRQMVTQIAVALANIEVYTQTQQRTRNKVLANEIVAKLQQQASLEEIITVTAQELGQALGAKHARIRLGKPPDQAKGQQ